MNLTLRKDADAIIASSLNAVLPDEAVRRALKAFAPKGGRVVLVAAGKAAWQMAHAAVEALGRVDGGVGTRTATGTTVHVGTVAVDKKVIPLGTEMFIVGSSGYTYGNAVAEDTGVRGAAIDLYMNSYQECKQFGRQKNSTVYFLD